ncbi:secretion protein HlyD [Thioploca ingrica]|uniref:Secretion protein HlyD n=1 Tax=Thioploca ingrica TaxID=40754 RepID=A0A090AFD9_9GAMM|nr:secretion protein HlyD [Thioploca ingrica]
MLWKQISCCFWLILNTGQAATIETIMAEIRPVPRFYEAPGRTIATQQMQLRATVNSFIRELAVREGDIVPKGTLLLALDDRNNMKNREEAQALIAAAQATLADATQDVQNFARLLTKNATSAERLRKAQLQQEQTRAALIQAQARLAVLNHEREYLQLTSPFKARVVERLVTLGDLVTVGTPLLRLEALDSIEFSAELPAIWIESIQVGQPVLIVLSGVSAPFIGQVTIIVKAVNPVTQTCTVKLRLGDATDVLTGVTGQAHFIIAKESLLLIPESTMVERAGIIGVFRLESQQVARFAAIRIGRSWQTYRSVIAGLRAGDKLINKPSAELRDGERVGNQP